MFNDKRSKKVILVAHCILNQNTKLDKCAHYPGTIREVAEILISRNIGIIQLPCPEMLYLGLDRETDKSTNSTVESEDTRISKRMLEEKSQSLCKKIIEDILYQIEEYHDYNFEIVGLIGINGSPTCGVDTSWSEDKEINGSGIFIKLLSKELQKRNITVKMTGIKAYDAEQAVKAVTEILLD